MSRSREEEGAEGRDEKTKQTPCQKEAKGVGEGGRTAKGKSCKGYLYYSSTLKSKGSNPRCIGIPRTLHQVPNYVPVTEIEASMKGRTLKDFYYGCAGYSVFVNKGQSTDKQTTQAGLPACVGLELLVDRKVSNADGKSAPAHDGKSAPAHVLNKEDGRELPQPRTHKPAHSAGDDFLSRYTRNASLVAAGVARNVQRVGNYIKESLDDILYPYRRRPK